MSDLFIPSFLMSDVSESLSSLTKNEQPWANRSGCSPKKSEWANRLFFLANRSFAHFFAKIKHFAQKTIEQIPNPVFEPKNRGQQFCDGSFYISSIQHADVLISEHLHKECGAFLFQIFCNLNLAQFFDWCCVFQFFLKVFLAVRIKSVFCLTLFEPVTYIATYDSQMVWSVPTILLQYIILNTYVVDVHKHLFSCYNSVYSGRQK